MKQLSLLCCLFLVVFAHAQTDTKPTQYTLGYFGNFAADQGLKIGAQIPSKPFKEDYQLYLNPQAGFFSKPLFHRTFIGNLDVGIRKQKAGNKLYTSAALGLGWMARQEVISFTTDFRGDIRARSYENWYYLVPTLSFEFGKDIYSSFGWYTKLNYGPKTPLTEDLESAGFFLLEMGVKFPLKMNQSASGNE